MTREPRCCALIGLGGIGAPAALALARAGGCVLRLIDPDCVERSNLARQFLYTEDDLGRPKVDAARARLAALAPSVVIETAAERFAPGTALRLLAGADLLLEGSDDVAGKFLAADCAHDRALPAVIAGALGHQGQLFVQAPGGACYRCLFEAPPGTPPPTCREAGVLSPLPALVAALAVEVLTAWVRAGRSAEPGAAPTASWLLDFDTARDRFRRLVPARRPDCRCAAAAADSGP